MTNLFDETLEVMEQHGRKPGDVRWIGSPGVAWFGWMDFERLARETDYDAGYGANEIPMDLVVVFRDGAWLCREEYDGSEWWSYQRCPRRPEAYRVPDSLRPDEELFPRSLYLKEEDR